VRFAVLTARYGWHDRWGILATTDGLTPLDCVSRQIEPKGFEKWLNGDEKAWKFVCTQAVTTERSALNAHNNNAVKTSRNLSQ